MPARTMSLSRSAFAQVHVKSVKAWALLYDGIPAGKVVANYSDNPAGSVVTATVVLWGGILGDTHSTGKARGYGYDKFSAAVADALARCGNDPGDMAGGGESVVDDWFQKHGYSTIHVI